MTAPTSTASDALEDIVHVDDPRFYLGDPFPIYARMRREAPVFWYGKLRTWVLTRYDDVKYVAKTPERFSVRKGSFLHDALRTTSSADELFVDAGEMIGTTDPPRHRELRRIATPPFTAPAIERLRATVEHHVDELLDRVVPGEEVEWVETVASRLPIHTACAMLGLPHDNIEQIRYWSDELERLANPLTPEEVADAARNFAGMVPYLQEQFAIKRREPDGAMISMLLEVELDNERLSEANVMAWVQLMIAAGNDTTRALISGIVATLAQFPEQRATLAADPSLIPAAIEEIMRWVTPARGFLRTVVDDAEVRGQRMVPGEHVYLAYDAANRDEDAFSEPETFDITAPRSHGQVALGYGTHVCIGAPLVRMEAKALLERLLARFPTWEITGEPVRTPTVLRSGWLELPVTFG